MKTLLNGAGYLLAILGIILLAAGIGTANGAEHIFNTLKENKDD